MSDFSNQFHLKSDNIEDAKILLKNANLKGYLIPPVNGWITILVAERAILTQFNKGLLLEFIRTDDALFWGFDLYRDANLISHYDIQDYFEGFKISNERLNFEEFSVELQLDDDKKEALKELFGVDNPDEADGGDYKFAEIIGLENIEWLSFEYADSDLESTSENYPEIFYYEP
ncbi:hypothetical protein [Runella zeae]|jgi:hypothetical protein|uniref:hypothetical protein n=1 Tax=Runella zeae TaxID=94255 RepID=UPI00041B0F4C|nr:hypothetical protein [Runella zeae]